jgi:molybdopterin-guanine dinucleotide biosynthesis protein A
MLTGLVLSGGEGSRIGQEKGLLNLNGDPMLSHVVDSMLGLVDEVIIAVGKGRAKLYEDYREIGFEIVEDREAGIGPLEGLICGMRVARGDYVIVGPCDTPFLKQDVCRVVLSRAEGKDGAVPIVRGMYEPLHGAYNKPATLRAFETALVSGKRKIADSYAGLDLVRVEESELRAVDADLVSFWNLNGPQEIALAEKRIIEIERR